MDSEIIGLLGLVVLMGLLMLRAPIGISLIAVSFSGIYYLIGPRPAFGMLASLPYDFASKWTLSSVPMFLLMGFVCFNAGLTRGLFQTARSWLAWLPGGLAVASVWGSAGFAAVTGSSIACCAAMGRWRRGPSTTWRSTATSSLSSTAMSSAERVGVPLKSRCSRKWVAP